jgi:hypothetical protein
MLQQVGGFLWVLWFPGVPENQRPASGLESMIYRTGGKQVNHYTTDVVPLYYQLT